tara:strand:- start:162 stop:602 length:441 start_codon:yes stop_codon:yes gene_type:complete
MNNDELPHKCDKLGDKVEGWNNCSICGVTDWKGLYKYKFQTVEVINLITQNVELCEKIVKEEILHNEFEIANDKQRKHHVMVDETLMADMVISYERNSTEIDIITYHIDCLSKKNRMLLFIQSHDFIFNTNWVETMRSMRRRGYEV